MGEEPANHGSIQWSGRRAQFLELCANGAHQKRNSRTRSGRGQILTPMRVRDSSVDGFDNRNGVGLRSQSCQAGGDMVRGCRELWDIGTATVVGPALEGSFVLKSSGPANTLFDQTLSMSKASRQDRI